MTELHKALNDALLTLTQGLSQLTQEVRELATHQKLVDAQLANGVRLHDDHETRLRVIEKKVWAAGLGGGGIGALGGALLAQLFSLIGG